MIVVWNQLHGETFGFHDLDAYKAYIRDLVKTTRHDPWADHVYDVGEGGSTWDLEPIDLSEFNLEITNAHLR